MKSKIRPDMYFLILLILSIVLHFIFPIEKIIFPPYTHLGFLFIVLGIILNIWADLLFKKNRTTVKPYKNPTELITSGPFRISRHPMYLGMMLILLGIAIVSGTLIAFVFPVVFIILIELFFIPFEEKNLERIFGRKYLSYKKSVRRWL
jgi:protein-S-isoprenylcysteine O-methyltransferase Ste14